MAFLDVFWYWFKTFIWKKYSKSQQTKCLGFIKLGVRAEQDICFERVINFVDFSQYLNFEGILTLCSQRLNRCPLKLENAEAEPSK